MVIKANKDKGILLFRVLASSAMIKVHCSEKLLRFQETLKQLPYPLALGSSFSSFSVFTNIFCAAPLYPMAFSYTAQVEVRKDIPEYRIKNRTNENENNFSHIGFN